MKIYTDKRLLAAGLVGGTLSRQSGNMRLLSNQELAYQELEIPPQKILHLHQVHKDTILSVSCTQEAQKLANCAPQDADAWAFSPLPTGWGAAIVTADCVPLFLWDSTGQYVSLAHCGWRGVVQGLPRKAAQKLLTHNPHCQLNAWLGPHIQSCCFEVQADVSKHFSPDCILTKNGKTFIDLNVEIKRQLTQAGLQKHNIYAPYYCTCGDNINFFSWRRDHEKNLLLSFIYKP